MQLAFNQPSITDTSISYVNQPWQPQYTVETRKNGTMSMHKTTRIYRQPGMQPIGHIELHSMSSDVVVTAWNGRDVRPSSAASLGFGSSKEFKSNDGMIYTWKWKSGMGWRLRDARSQDVVTLIPGSNLLPVLNFARPVSAQLQDEIVLTCIYLEQRRREDEKTAKTARKVGKIGDVMDVGMAGHDSGWFGGGDGSGGGGDGGGGGGGDGGGGGGAV